MGSVYHPFFHPLQSFKALKFPLVRVMLSPLCSRYWIWEFPRIDSPNRGCWIPGLNLRQTQHRPRASFLSESFQLQKREGGGCRSPKGKAGSKSLLRCTGQLCLQGRDCGHLGPTPVGSRGFLPAVCTKQFLLHIKAFRVLGMPLAGVGTQQARKMLVQWGACPATALAQLALLTQGIFLSDSDLVRDLDQSPGPGQPET